MQPTMDALAAFPDRLEALYRSVPDEHRLWAPASWEGLYGETFTALEHLCHLRDIEVDGYHVRFRRALDETCPELESLDGYALAKARAYGAADGREVLARFSAARAETMRLLSGLAPAQWLRPAVFEGGAVTVRGLAHLLCHHDQLHLAGLHWLLAKMPAAR